jgi:hypothetical protein
VSPFQAEPLLIEPLLIDHDVTAAGPIVLAVPVQDPAPPPGKGEEFGEASPVALVVIVLLAIITALLIRSMTRRIRRLPPSFDPTEGKPVGSADAEQGRGDGERGSGDAGSGPA